LDVSSQKRNETMVTVNSQSGDRARPGYGEGREALLAATVCVVARRGLRHLTYRAVAEEAGVTHGLVAHYFGSRSALIEQALVYCLSRSMVAGSLEPGTGMVQDFSVGLPAMVTDNPDDQAFQYELILESRRRPELRRHVHALYQAYRDAAGRELTRMGLDNDPALTHLVFAALDGLVFQQLALDEAPSTEGALEKLRGVLRTLQHTRIGSAAPSARDGRPE
jgi:AcrR family transcriptional regulator